MSRIHLTAVAILLCLSALLTGCGTTDITVPVSGAVEIGARTTGGTFASHFSVSLDGGPGTALPANGSITVSDLAEGQHTVTLGGLPFQCAASGPSRRTVVVTVGDTAVVTFNVGCGPGLLRVRTLTNGVALDPDGYLLTIDSDSTLPAAVNDTVEVDGLAPGNHSVALSGVAPNCGVSGGNTRSFAVSPAGVGEVEFDIVCAGLVGGIEARVTTTGSGLDPDGYLVSLDGDPGQPAPVLGTMRLDNLAPGDHTVELTGVATNCSVQGDSRRSVAVTVGNVTPVEFTISCVGRELVGILFQKGSVFPLYRLYRMSSDGSGAIDLTPDSDGQDGDWSPDGRKIAFTSYRSGNAQIYVMNSDGSGVTRLTSGPDDATDPTWSPDSKKIAFVSGGVSGSSVYVMNADGSRTLKITGNSGGFQPSWSPDGSRIAFSRVTRICRFDVCAADIFVIPAAGGFATNITQNADGVAYNPSWSPDATRIAYEQNRQIFVIQIDGTAKTKLSGDPAAQDVAPIWAPDGSRIAFNRYDPNGGIFVMNADGTGAKGIGSGTATSWR